MTRYIDVDALYASIAKDTYILTDRINSRDYGMYLIGIKQKIDEAPTIDAVEVVRCRNCRRAEQEIEVGDNGVVDVGFYCNRDGLYHSGDYYCADGEWGE